MEVKRINNYLLYPKDCEPARSQALLLLIPQEGEKYVSK
jgi:hypothetical protein